MLDDCLGVVVGDVSSHGMGPALLMSETRACLRTLAQVHSDVGEILTRANRLLAADASDFHFVTLAMARLDPRDRSMVYASAGQRGYLLHSRHRGDDAGQHQPAAWACGPTRSCRRRRADRARSPAIWSRSSPTAWPRPSRPAGCASASPGRCRSIRSERDKPAAEIIEVVAPGGSRLLPQPAAQRRHHDRGGEGDGLV